MTNFAIAMSVSFSVLFFLVGYLAGKGSKLKEANDILEGILKK